jgi:hypothetical protein
MAKYTHDVVASNGEYTDKQTGEKKKRYINCGKIFTEEDGRQSIKLDVIPVGPGWSGWLAIYPRKDDGYQQRPTQHQQQKSNGYAPQSGEDEPW